MELRLEGNTVTFWLRAKPRSSRQRLTTDASGDLRLEIHAAATEGQANEACVEFLARALRLPKSSISIVSGERSKRKLMRVVAANPEQVVTQLQALAVPRR
jgi:uncharacterized protein